MNKRKIALVVPKSVFLTDPNVWEFLGLNYIGARLESFGHEVEHFDLNIEELPKDGEFDYLFVTATSPQKADVRRIGELTRGWKTKRVLGGSMATTNPKTCEELEYDLVVSGEAEEPKNLQLVLDTLENNPDVKFLKLLPPSNLNHVIPPLRRWSYKYKAFLKDRIDDKTLKMSSVYTTYGCVYLCKFCDVSRGAGLYSKVRFEPIDVVEYQFREIKELGYDAVGIYDDTILMNKKRLIVIMDLLEKYDLKWRCFLRSDLLERHGGLEFLRLMRDKGLREIFVGVESGDQRIKDNISKGTTTLQDANVVKWCKELQVTCKTSFIIGLPGESFESIQKTKEWILENNPERVQIGILIPLPGTPLYERVEEFDLKYEKQPDEKFFYSGKFEEMTSFVSTSFMTKEEIDIEYEKLYLELKDKGINLS